MSIATVVLKVLLFGAAAAAMFVLATNCGSICAWQCATCEVAARHAFCR